MIEFESIEKADWNDRFILEPMRNSYCKSQSMHRMSTTDNFDLLLPKKVD